MTNGSSFASNKIEKGTAMSIFAAAWNLTKRSGRAWVEVKCAALGRLFAWGLFGAIVIGGGALALSVFGSANAADAWVDGWGGDWHDIVANWLLLYLAVSFSFFQASRLVFVVAYLKAKGSGDFAVQEEQKVTLWSKFSDAFRSKHWIAQRKAIALWVVAVVLAPFAWGAIVAFGPDWLQMAMTMPFDLLRLIDFWPADYMAPLAGYALLAGLGLALVFIPLEWLARGLRLRIVQKNAP
jgi:hypothetical protein